MVLPTTILAAFSFFITFAYSMPTINSTTLLQNAHDAQVLNSEFRNVQDTDACNSGRAACVGGALAVCKFGSWQTNDCGDSKECFAVPSTTGSGTDLICTSQISATAMFKAAGLDDLYSNGTDTIAFPTTSPPSVSPMSPGVASQTDGVDIVTVTVTIPILPTPTTLSTETRTLDPAEAVSILSSISAKGSVATSATHPVPAETTAPPSTRIGHCQETASASSVMPFSD